MVDERDRRDDGRPEQTRPRDRTGRPLPYGTTDVPLREEHEPSTVEEALELGVRLWNERRYFEAHECLELVWHAAPEQDTDLWQGVIQVAVAGVHVQRGNLGGAISLFERAARRLAAYPEVHRGIAVEVARQLCAAAVVRLRAGEQVELPDVPAAHDGPWFTPDPGALQPPESPTPVPDEPTWVAAGRPRRPRRRGDP